MSSSFFLHRQRLIFLLVIAGIGILALGCSERKDGSSEPPTAFGAKSWSFFGCPTIQGSFAWPPIRGQYSQVPLYYKDQQFVEEGFPILIRSSVAQIWITQDSSKIVFHVRNKMTRRDLSSPNLLEWGYLELARTQFSCSDGVIDVELGEASEGFKKKQQYGGKGVFYGYRMVALRDGSIAIGRKIEVYGRNESLLNWGDGSFGVVPLPDKTYWKWMQLQRTGSGESEPPPIIFQE
jgi:hypothetical protein